MLTDWSGIRRRSGDGFHRAAQFFQIEVAVTGIHAHRGGVRPAHSLGHLGDFPALLLGVAPQLGHRRSHLMIIYANGMPNYNVLHAGMPVEGYKVIITKWFREHGSGPMFYPD